MFISLRPSFNLSSPQTKCATRFNAQTSSTGHVLGGKIRFNGLSDVDRLDMRHYPPLTAEDKRSIKHDPIIKLNPDIQAARRIFELDRSLHLELDGLRKVQRHQIPPQILEVFSQFAFRTSYRSLAWEERHQVQLACMQIVKDYGPERNNRNVKPIEHYLDYMQDHNLRILTAFQAGNEHEALQHFKDWVDAFDDAHAAERAIQRQFTRMREGFRNGDTNLGNYRPSKVDEVYESGVVSALNSGNNTDAFEDFKAWGMTRHKSWGLNKDPEKAEKSMRKHFERMHRNASRGEAIRLEHYLPTYISPEEKAIVAALNAGKIEGDDGARALYAAWARNDNPQAADKDIDKQFKRLHGAANRGATIHIDDYAVVSK